MWNSTYGKHPHYQSPKQRQHEQAREERRAIVQEIMRDIRKAATQIVTPRRVLRPVTA